MNIITQEAKKRQAVVKMANRFYILKFPDKRELQNVEKHKSGTPRAASLTNE